MARVHLARHLANTAALAELTRVRVRDALRRWLPEVDAWVDVIARDNQHVVRVAVGNDSYSARMVVDLIQSGGLQAVLPKGDLQGQPAVFGAAANLPA